MTAPDFKNPSSEQYSGTYGSVPVGGRNTVPPFTGRQLTLIFKEPRGTHTETSPAGKARSAETLFSAQRFGTDTAPSSPPTAPASPTCSGGGHRLTLGQQPLGQRSLQARYETLNSYVRFSFPDVQNSRAEEKPEVSLQGTAAVRTKVAVI